jgi:hypothetical protein
MDENGCKKLYGNLPRNGDQGIDKGIYEGDPKVFVAQHFPVIAKARKGLIQHRTEIPVKEAHEKKTEDGVDRKKAKDA